MFGVASDVLAKGQVVFVQSDPDDPLRIEPAVVQSDPDRLRAGAGLAPIDVSVDGVRRLILRRCVHLSERHALEASLAGEQPTG